ncbi:MAG: DUF58 domain-containing protein [Terriglobales bacterium]
MSNSFAAEKTPIPFTAKGPRWPHLEISALWIRFLLAIAGLLLAFVAALFSTLSREAGNLWGTLISASIALFLAVFVGLTTVPYLAKRVAASRIRGAVDYKVNRLGLIYAAVVLFIGIAALNTGNNLLYIVVAAMLAAILVSGVVSAIVLRDLELDVRVPEHVFAGETTQGHLTLRNPRRWLPSFSVSVVPLNSGKKKQWQWKATTFAFPPARPPQEQWLRLPDRKLQRVARAAKASSIFSGTTYFPYIPPRDVLRAALDFSFARRGHYKEERLGLASGFPFAFLTKTRHVPLVREILVYPSVRGASDEIELFSSIAGEFETFVRGGGNDFYRLREYMPGDSARHIDWKATAKTDALKVREFSREDNRRLRIIFDNPVPGSLSHKKYEEMVAKAASLAWHFSGQNIGMSYLTQGYRGTDVHAFLKVLATVEAARAASIFESLELSGEYNIIVTTRETADAPSNLRECSYFVRPAR